MIDVNGHISSVERRVGTRTLAAGEARTVTIARVFDTSPEDLWDACTDPERISRWFLPISGDLRLGGRYAFEGNASGTIERCEPPARVDATWEFGGQTSWVELRLTPEPDGRARFALRPHRPRRRRALGAVRPGRGRHRLGPRRARPDACTWRTPHSPSGRPSTAWQASDEGRAFVRLASERWAEASIAAGTDPAEARAAETRVTDAYTGQPAA